MNRFRSYLAVLALASAFGAHAAAAQSDAKIDVTGKWVFNVTTSAGNGTPNVTLKQKGDSVTGHYSSQTLGETELKGTVKDRKITFRFPVSEQGTTLTVTYTGTIETKDSMKGTVDIGGMANGTFTAKRS
jgi:hypothetical protein